MCFLDVQQGGGLSISPTNTTSSCFTQTGTRQTIITLDSPKRLHQGFWCTKIILKDKLFPTRMEELGIKSFGTFSCNVTFLFSLYQSVHVVDAKIMPAVKIFILKIALQLVLEIFCKAMVLQNQWDPY